MTRCGAIDREWCACTIVIDTSLTFTVPPGVHGQGVVFHLEAVRLGYLAHLVVADELRVGAPADLEGVADVVHVSVGGDDDVGLAHLRQLDLRHRVVVEPGVEVDGRAPVRLELERGVAEKGDLYGCHLFLRNLI